MIKLAVTAALAALAAYLAVSTARNAGVIQSEAATWALAGVAGALAAKVLK